MNCVFLVLYLGAEDTVTHTECLLDGLAVPSAPLDIFAMSQNKLFQAAQHSGALRPPKRKTGNWGPQEERDWTVEAQRGWCGGGGCVPASGTGEYTASWLA